MLVFKDLQNTYLQEIEDRLQKYLPNHDLLGKSMIYSLSAKAKRIRPLLVIAAILDLGGVVDEDVYKVVVALEWVHTYSLIHDDLPAMDDDALRRGKPTNHKVFGEATAILAGDALLTDAFDLLTTLEIEPKKQVKLIHSLARAAGSQGMVQGQMLDLAGENKELTLDEVKEIHKLKTGALLEYSVMAGAILASASQEDQKLLMDYASHLGVAFQIRDDILDIISSTKELGKEVGQDEKLDKSTYPSLMGVDRSKELLQLEINLALDSLEKMEKPMLRLQSIIEQLEVK